MEKLIELLKEYDEYRWEKRRDYWWTKNKVELDVKMIIFKKFWFIKRLVENDKIDYKKLREEREDLCDVNLRHLRNKYIDVVSLSYVKLLMLLSIQDEPIKFLISILK